MVKRQCRNLINRIPVYRIIFGTFDLMIYFAEGKIGHGNDPVYMMFVFLIHPFDIMYIAWSHGICKAFELFKNHFFNSRKFVKYSLCRIIYILVAENQISRKFDLL